MGEFFLGWRRKVGLVTLGMACLFMAGWVNGQRYGYRMDWLDDHDILGELTSTDDGIRFRKLQTHIGTQGIRFTSVDALRTVTVPYWSITIPLTLISLWLLLSKPHQSNQKKTIGPISEKLK